MTLFSHPRSETTFKKRERKGKKERYLVGCLLEDFSSNSVLLVENRLNVGLSSGSFLSFSFLSSSFILPKISLTTEGFGGEKKMRVLEENRTARMDCCHFVNSQESGRSFG